MWQRQDCSVIKTHPFRSIEEKGLIPKCIRIGLPDANDDDEGEGAKGEAVQPTSKSLRFLRN